MKTKSLISISVLLFISLNCFSQFVMIPDSVFRIYIKTNISSSAIVGDSLDTTNVAVMSLKELRLKNNIIYNLNGIQYFDSLLTLELNNVNTLDTISSFPLQLKVISVYNNFNVTAFPDFPYSLEELYVRNYYMLQSLPALPVNLKKLSATNTPLSVLPSLPVSLQEIELAYNNVLTSLPTLPDSLKVLSCKGLSINLLPALPTGMRRLSVISSSLTSVPALPSSLTELNLYNNSIAVLPALPPDLITMEVSNNLLATLPALPPALKYLRCIYNSITSMPVLPLGLIELNCKNNSISCLPLLPATLKKLDYIGCVSNRPDSLEGFFEICNVPVTYIETPDTLTCDDSLIVAGGYLHYEWSTGDTTNYAANICRGAYSCTITDSLGCIYNAAADIADTVLWFTYITSTGASCVDGPYIIDVSVHGGNPPYTFQWVNNIPNNNAQFCNTCEDLIGFNFEDFYPDIASFNCIVTDAVGRVDSIYIDFYPNYRPIAVGGIETDPLCPQYHSGEIWTWSSHLSNDGPTFEFHYTDLDSGYHVFAVPYGNGCEELFEYWLTYQIDNCDSAVTFDVFEPDCGMCNGNVIAVDHLGGNVGDLYDDNGNSVQQGQFCMGDYHADFNYQIDMNNEYQNSYTVTVSVDGCSPVYPGDANNDGVANNLDLLNIGIAFNDTGSVRVDTTITWDGKYAQDWNNVFADSVNHKFADCNGNGVINDDDTTAISLNYGLTHPRFTNPVSISGIPTLNINIPDTIHSPGLAMAEMEIGDTLNVCNDLYGVVFTVTYDKNVAGALRFIPDSTWFGSEDDFLVIQKDFSNDGYLDVGITRKDHVNRFGYGSIGHLEFIVPGGIANGSVTLAVANVKAISNTEQDVQLNTGADSAVVISQCILTAVLNVTNGCSGPCSGAISVNATWATGSLGYDWSLSNYDTTCGVVNLNGSYVDSLPSGNYICIVSDSSGCSYAAAMPVYTSSMFVSTLNRQYESCSACDGSISITVDGGHAPYSYIWEDNSTMQNLMNVCTYYEPHSCLIQDSIGCIYYIDVEGEDYAEIAANVTDATCSNTTDGLINVGYAWGISGHGPYTGGFVNPSSGSASFDPVLVLYTLDYCEPGTYTFMQITRNGCDTSFMPITVGYDNPANGNVTIAYTDCDSCNGGVTAFTGADSVDNINTFVTWNVNNNPNSQLVLTGLCFNDVVDYTIEENGCSTYGIITIDSCYVVQSVNTQGKEQIRIRPNPNNGRFILESLPDNSLIEIVQSDGKIIYSEKINGNEHELNLRATPGMYLCRIKNKEGVRQIKFVVE